METLIAVQCCFCGKLWRETHHDCQVAKTRFLNPAFKIVYQEDEDLSNVLSLDEYRKKKLNQ